MNRNFIDSWNVIFDSHNKPLLGKLEFYESDTTSLKTIYTTEGKELNNPIYVNGRPSTQIMLGDGDYSVKFYEYIGHGDMEHDTDYNNWFDYKTILLCDGSIVNDITNEISTVITIDDLKNLQNMHDNDIVQVMGYYKLNDCPSRYFIWHATGNANDDGGIIIKSNKTTQGYWQMKIPGTYIDVRWYGDIPSNFVSAASSNLGQRTKAASAANYYKKDLYFPSYAEGNALGFYMFDGSNTVSVSKDIICDNGVRFVVKSGTVGTKVQCHELHKCDKYLFISTSKDVQIGDYSLEANWINTSWLDSSQANAEGARVGYVIDYLASPLNFTNTKIKFERDGLNMENVRFDNCEFVDCNHNINKPSIFVNMEVKQEWFDSDFDFVAKCSYTNCKILLRNFKNADTYIKMKNKQNERDYGDLGEQIVNNALVYPGGTIENCYGSISLPPTTTGEYEMHNCSLTINGITNNKNFNLVDCWITIPETSMANNFSLRRGAIIGAQFESIGQVYLENVETNAILNLQAATRVEIRNCKLNANVIGRKISVYDSHIFNNAKIIQYDTNGVLIPVIIGNTFEIGTYYEPIALTTGTKVANGRINHNIGIDKTKHWIKLNRMNFDQHEYLHDYQYVGNVEPYMTATNDVSHYMKKYDHDTGISAIGANAPWIETPGKGYNAGGDPQWMSLYNYDFIKLRCFSFGLIPQCYVTMDYTQSLIYVASSYRHPYYTFVLRDGLRALDAAGATDSTYEFVLGGGTSYEGLKYVNIGCDIYGHTGDDDYPRGYFYATIKFNIDRKQSTGLNDRRKDWTV